MSTSWIPTPPHPYTLFLGLGSLKTAYKWLSCIDQDQPSQGQKWRPQRTERAVRERHKEQGSTGIIRGNGNTLIAGSFNFDCFQEKLILLWFLLMHVKSVAIAMTSVCWNLLTAAGLRSKISLLIMLLMLIVMNLDPPSQPLYHVHFPPWSPGQKEGQDKSLLMSLDRHVDNGLGNMVQLWPCSREGEPGWW